MPGRFIGGICPFRFVPVAATPNSGFKDILLDSSYLIGYNEPQFYWHFPITNPVPEPVRHDSVPNRECDDIATWRRAFVVGIRLEDGAWLGRNARNYVAEGALSMSQISRNLRRISDIRKKREISGWGGGTAALN
jgi:hypothetical protein